MANEEHVERLRSGSRSWNEWRQQNANIRINLSGAHLVGLDCSGCDLRGADLQRANLSNASLENADLLEAYLFAAMVADADLNYARLVGSNLHRTVFEYANLKGARFDHARLSKTDFTHANLSGASFARAEMYWSILTGADLRGADFAGAKLGEVFFLNVDLSETFGLGVCAHSGPSSVDYRTLHRSGRLSLSFLRGVGLPNSMIDYLPSLLDEAISFYTCFISYSSKDRHFAERVHADLQNVGIRCWFAQHDMPIGGKILDEIDSAIRLRDKVLLVLSEHSINSDWVEDEVTKAFEEERKRGQIVLFPIRLDDAVIDTNEPWAAKLRARHIGDFTRWKEHDEYQKSFERVLRDLTVKKP